MKKNGKTITAAMMNKTDKNKRPLQYEVYTEKSIDESLIKELLEKLALMEENWIGKTNH